MTRIVRDLLQLSNIDYNKTNWKKDNLDLGKLLMDILNKLDLLIKEKNHIITLDIQENLPNIVADKDGIEQVILNIISNAIKYTESHGNINIHLLKDGSHICFKVKDSGIGIPKEDMNRLFERFYRVEKGRSREMGGTGLGLSIAKEIVEAHNGSIEVDSVLGEGTEMTIRLPLV